MNLRRFFPHIALVIGAVLLSVGIQTYAAFSEPTEAPPNGNTYAPLTTSGEPQAKVAGLVVHTGLIDPDFPNGFYVQHGNAIVADGNVGIGTTNPVGLLHLNKITGPTGIRFSADNYNSYGVGNIELDSAGLNFYTGTSPSNRMIIKNDGNVGIGTTNPQAKLHIYGSGVDAGAGELKLENTAGDHPIL